MKINLTIGLLAIACLTASAHLLSPLWKRRFPSSSWSGRRYFHPEPIRSVK